MPREATYKGTTLTARQWEVVRMRAEGMTQAEVAKKLHTTRENVSIIEKRAQTNLRASRATVDALMSLSASHEVLIPSGTSVFEATSMTLLRADVLGIKVKMSADDILAHFRSKCRGKIRGHHLTAPVRVRIEGSGALTIL